MIHSCELKKHLLLIYLRKKLQKTWTNYGKILQYTRLVLSITEICLINSEIFAFWDGRPRFLHSINELNRSHCQQHQYYMRLHGCVVIVYGDSCSTQDDSKLCKFACESNIEWYSGKTKHFIITIAINHMYLMTNTVWNLHGKFRVDMEPSTVCMTTQPTSIAQRVQQLLTQCLPALSRGERESRWLQYMGELDQLALFGISLFV